MRRDTSRSDHRKSSFAPQAKPNTFDLKRYDTNLIILVGYLISLAFEGPIRLAFSIAHIETLLYARDVLAIYVVISSSFWRPKEDEHSVNITAIFLYAIICHSMISLWIGHPLSSILFAIKIFMALLVGLSCGKYLRTNGEFFTKFITFLFIACSAGAIINKLYGVLPWEGAEFESAFGSATNRVWWAGGERRLPGFARVSTTTAAAIGITGVFLAAYTRSYLLKIAIFSVGISAIYITTSKGVILSFVIVGLWCFIPRGELQRKSGIWLLWANALAAIVIPFVSAYIHPNPNIMRQTPNVLSSFAERVALTWPNAIDDLSNWHLWIVGQGVGGIGGPLRFGHEYYRFNPIDNLFLYSFTIFGILGVFYYIFAAMRITKIAEKGDAYHLGLLAMGIHFFCYGITAHQVEDPFESMWLGMIITYIAMTKPNLYGRTARRSADYHACDKPKNDRHLEQP